MPENLVGMAVLPSYSQIVEAIPDEQVHATLKRDERDAEMLARTRERISSDPDLNDEAKARKTAEAEETDHRRDLHRRRLEGARRYEMAAGVLPSGKAPTPNPFGSPRRHSPHASMPSGSRVPLFTKKPRKRAWK